MERGPSEFEAFKWYLRITLVANAIVLYSLTSNHWKLADFGFTAAVRLSEMTTGVHAKGTQGYRAPEVLQNSATFNQEADIWALGCIFHELVTHRKAFESDFDVQRYAQVRQPFKVPPISFHYADSAQFFDATLKKTLQIETAERPSASSLLFDCRKFDDELHSYEDPAPVSPNPPDSLISNPNRSSSPLFSIIKQLTSPSKLHAFSQSQGNPTTTRRPSIASSTPSSATAFDFDKNFFRLLGKERGFTLTAVSHGQKMVVLVKELTFWVFEVSSASLICMGKFSRGNAIKRITRQGDVLFKYGYNEPLQYQHPSPDPIQMEKFFTVALSEEFLVLGAKATMVIISLRGGQSGRWIARYTDQDPEAIITNLAFSGDGKELIVLLVTKAGLGKALICSTDTFPGEADQHRKPTKVVFAELSLQSGDYLPTLAAFSMNGDLIAICTRPWESKAGFILLKKVNDKWEVWGFKELEVFPRNQPWSWHSYGITGVAL